MAEGCNHVADRSGGVIEPRRDRHSACHSCTFTWSGHRCLHTTYCPMDNRDSSILQTTLAKLHIPADFARYPAIAETEPETILRLERWKIQVLDVLSDLRAQLAQEQLLSLSEKAEVISTIAPWDGVAPWTLDSTREIAQSTYPFIAKYLTAHNPTRRSASLRGP